MVMETRNAQLSTPIVFWQDSISGQIVMGLPERFPAPPYYNKLVARTAHDAEHYSQMMREQEASREAIVDEQREETETAMLRNLRSHMHSQMANARNAMNRDFLKIWLERHSDYKDPTKTKRESYLHAEGFEAGH
jgi:hypothetical protein